MAVKKKKGDKGGANPCRVITPKFRVSYPAVFKPKSFEDEKGNKTKEKYQCVMLFPKDTDMSPIRKAIFAAKKAKFGPDKNKWPKKMRATVRDGDEKEDTDGYEGMYFITANGDRKPGLIGPDKEPITEESEFYAGCWARAEVVFYGYDMMGNKGVGCGLRNLIKVADDEAFSGQVSAEEAFQDVEVEDQDDDDGEEGDDEEEDEDEDTPPKKAKKKKAKPADDDDEEDEEEEDDADEDEDDEEEEDDPPPRKKKKKRSF